MPGSVLLDTNALLWMVADPDRIAPAAHADLASAETELIVSAASAWEIAIKTRSGRLAGGDVLLSVWGETLSSLQAQSVAITAEDAIMAGGLPWPHRDPFDRMLVAQAARRGLTIASSDAILLAAAMTPTLDTRR